MEFDTVIYGHPVLVGMEIGGMMRRCVSSPVTRGRRFIVLGEGKEGNCGEGLHHVVSDPPDLLACEYRTSGRSNVPSVNRPAQKTLACLFKTQITRCLPAAQRFALLALLEKNLTRACKVQALINSPRFIEQEKLDRTNAGFITGKR
ncbi:hypothetical protein J6590_013015 [Homalodisca vitripennis]|nr:hypothetical protein J6590_013015 [Homalodisca vitripennis]